MKIIDEWQPVGMSFAARGTQLFGNLAAFDGGQQVQQFAQTVLGGKASAKSALETLQSSLGAVLK